MISFRTTIAACLLVASSLPLATADEQPNPRENVETAVLEGIRLLEAKDYTTFLKTFVAPDELAKILEEVPLDQLAEQFGAKKAPRLLDVLKMIKDAKPTLDAEGKTASYELKNAIGGKKGIQWKKVDKFWYITN